MFFVVVETRELKRMREILDNVNITNMSTNNNDEPVDIIFNETLNVSDSNGNRKTLPHNIRNRQSRNESLSDNESKNENDNDTINSYNSNGKSKAIGDLNTNNLLRTEKER